MFSVNYLEAFFHVVETHSCSEAARRMKRTQPTVSTAISRLEVQIGLKLFERPAFTPTPAALELYHRYYSVFAMITELNHRAEGSTGIPFALGASEYILREHLVPIVGLLAQRCPGIVITLRAGPRDELERMLAAKELNLIVLTVDRPSPAFSWRKFLTVSPVLLVPKQHPLREANALWSRSEIRDPLICPPQAEGVTRLLDQFLRRHRIDWRPTTTTSSTALVPPAVRAMNAIGPCVDVPTLTEWRGVRPIACPELGELSVGAFWLGEASATLLAVLDLVEQQANAIARNQGLSGSIA